MAREKKPVHKVQMTEGKRNIIHQLVSCIIKIPIIAEGSPQSCRGNFPIIADLCLVFP